MLNLILDEESAALHAQAAPLSRYHAVCVWAFPGARLTDNEQCYSSLLNGDRTAGINGNRVVSTGSLRIIIKRRLGAVDHNDDCARSALPARLSLTRGDSHGPTGVGVGEVLGHNGRISGTDVRNVGSLTAAFELGGEHRDGDGNEDGRQRLISGKTVRIKRIPPYQESFPPYGSVYTPVGREQKSPATYNSSSPKME